MRIFRSDDGAEIREEDVRALTRAYEYGFGKGVAFEAADRVLAALSPKPKLFSKPGVEIPCKVEVDPDGATTWTPLEKLKVQPGDSFTLVAQPGDKFTMVLKPKTCGAILPVMVQNVGSGGYSGPQRCVLPAGHHPFDPVTDQGDDPYSVICRRPCNKVAVNPIHSPGHMTAPECWRESVPAGGSFRVSLETEVNTKP